MHMEVREQLYRAGSLSEFKWVCMGSDCPACPDLPLYLRSYVAIFKGLFVFKETVEGSCRGWYCSPEPTSN